MANFNSTQMFKPLLHAMCTKGILQSVENKINFVIFFHRSLESYALHWRIISLHCYNRVLSLSLFLSVEICNMHIFRIFFLHSQNTAKVESESGRRDNYMSIYFLPSERLAKNLIKEGSILSIYLRFSSNSLKILTHCRMYTNDGHLMVLGVFAEQIFLISTLAILRPCHRFEFPSSRYLRTNKPETCSVPFCLSAPRHYIICAFCRFCHHVDRGALTQHHRGEKQAGLLFALSIYNRTAGIFGFTSTLINMTFHEIYEWISYSVALSAALRRNGAKKWLWLFLTCPSAPPLIECAERDSTAVLTLARWR